MNKKGSGASVTIEEQVGAALHPISDLIADPDVSDIFVYGKDRVFVKSRGKKLSQVARNWTEKIDLIVACNTIAQKMRRKLNGEYPILDARLEDGSRVNIVIEPVFYDGACISIRKFPKERYSLDHLLNKGTLDENGKKIIGFLVKSGKRIVISGGTGTGKTTLLNAICEFIGDDEIIVTIEDSRELNLSGRVWVPLESKPAFYEKEREITLRDLVINSLRMFPQWIILGEVRGGEVFDLMRAFNSGHCGMTTLHANSCEDALFALENMFLQGKEMRIDAVKQIISRAVDIVIQLRRFKDESIRIVEIGEVCGIEERDSMQEYKLNPLYIYSVNKTEKNGKLSKKHKVKSVPFFIKKEIEFSDMELPVFWRD